jgi:hypothetical protein
MSSAEDKPRGFVVSDRRVFTPGGESKEEGAAAGPAGAPAETPREAAAEFGADPTEPGGPSSGEKTVAGGPPPDRLLPPVDFSTFVLSLGSSALMHLGEIENPTSGTASKNLPLAKHSIDILSMLEEKTRNNLNTTEAQLLENLLYDLRLRYVTAAKPKST